VKIFIDFSPKSLSDGESDSKGPKIWRNILKVIKTINEMFKSVSYEFFSYV
jgi:hypothetical protein